MLLGPRLQWHKFLLSFVIISALFMLTPRSAYMQTLDDAPHFAQTPFINLQIEDSALAFVERRRPANLNPSYMVSESGGTTIFDMDKILFYPAKLADQSHTPPITLRFIDASDSLRIANRTKLPGTLNYFAGNDPTQWITGVSTYDGISYRQLYRGIDLFMSGEDGVLKGTYEIAPHTEPLQIRWRYENDVHVIIDDNTGDLLVFNRLQASGIDRDTALLRESAPIAWQIIDGRRISVDVRFAINHEGTISFEVAQYDAAYPLIIDPEITYSTLIGGSENDTVEAIAVDEEGNTYITGKTSSPATEFPDVIEPENALQGTNAYVTKINPNGIVEYTTYLGGQNNDAQGTDIAVDVNGNVVIGGYTSADDFPTTANVVQPASLNETCSNDDGSTVCTDGFIVRLDNAGTIDFSTYIGGSQNDSVSGVSQYSSHNKICAVGTTTSPDFLVDAIADNKVRKIVGNRSSDGTDVFVACLPYPINNVTHLTFLGGNGIDHGNDISHKDSIIYITGDTTSTDFPIVNAPANNSYGGEQDAFVAGIVTRGERPGEIWFSMYHGGSRNDIGRAIEANGSREVYVTGYTTSADLPITHTLPLTNSFQSIINGESDAFLAHIKVDTSNSPITVTLRQSTYIGGSLGDQAYDITVDTYSQVYVTGVTGSADFPIRAETAPQSQFNGNNGDAFVLKLPRDIGAIAYGTYLGGTSDDEGKGIAVDRDHAAYVAGNTVSIDFPATISPRFAGENDIFVAKLSPPTAAYPPKTFDCNAATDIPTVECEALVALYNSTDGIGWVRNSGWLQSTTPCRWYGVICERGHVGKLLLGFNQLRGTLPDELGNLNNLRDFQAHANYLVGSIPTSLGQLQNLFRLYLQANSITGEIPSELGNAINLSELYLGGNQLTGSIPPKLIGNLSELTILRLQGNQLSGEISNLNWSNLSKIRWLFLNQNNFSGSIPASLGDLKELSILYLYQNQLTGSIPASLGALPKLRFLNLSSNDLSGPIPPELGQLCDRETGLGLTQLHLHNNDLSGSIPSELGNLCYLYLFDIRSNRLQGELPANLVNMGSDAALKMYINYNALDAEDNSPLDEWLIQRLGNWKAYQTIPPRDVSVTNVTSSTIELSWTPVLYKPATGIYEIGCTPTLGEPPIYNHSIGRDATRYVVDGLEPDTTYYCSIRSFTPTENNNVESKASAPVSTKTLVREEVADYLFIFALALDTDPNSPGNLSGHYRSAIEAIEEAMQRQENRIAVVLYDLPGEDNTEIRVFSTGQQSKSVQNGLPDVTGTLQQEILEYNMADGDDLGGFIKWARDTYPATKSVFSFVGHGLAVVPKLTDEAASLDTLIGGPAALGGQTIFAAGQSNQPTLPSFRGAHPDWTDITPMAAFISPPALARALDIGTNNGADPLHLLDLTHCFAATYEEFFELANPDGNVYAEAMTASPNYTYFSSELLASMISVPTNDEPDSTANGLIAEYSRILAEIDATENDNAQEANSDTEAGHPHIFVAVNSAKIKAVKSAWDTLVLFLWENFNEVEFETAYGKSQLYDTTFCSNDWNLARDVNHADSLVDMHQFVKNLKSFSPATPDSNAIFDEVIVKLQEAVIGTTRKDGAPWFAFPQTPEGELAPKPIWSFGTSLGVALYAPLSPTRFDPYEGQEGQRYLDFQYHWYTDTIRSEETTAGNRYPQQVYKFLDRDAVAVADANGERRIWSDILERRWAGYTIKTEACLPELPPIQGTGELSVTQIIFPDNIRGMVSVGTPITPVVAIETVSVAANVLVHFEIREITGAQETIVYSDTVATEHIANGEHAVQASKAYTPTSINDLIISAIVDYDDRFTESDETNNRYQQSYEEIVNISPVLEMLVEDIGSKWITDSSIPLHLYGNVTDIRVKIFQYQQDKGAPDRQVPIERGKVREAIQKDPLNPKKGMYNLSLNGLLPGPVELHIWGEDGANLTAHPHIIEFNYAPMDLIDVQKTKYFLLDLKYCDRAVLHLNVPDEEEDVNIFAWNPINYWSPDYRSTDVGSDKMTIYPPRAGQYVVGINGQTDIGESGIAYSLTVDVESNGCGGYNATQVIASSLEAFQNNVEVPTQRPDFLQPIPRLFEKAPTPTPIIAVYLPFVSNEP